MTVIDMTRRKRRWGHNLNTFEPPKNFDADYKVAMWVTPKPKLGDFVKWDTNYGYCYLEVVHVKWTINVDDMYWVNLKVHHRTDKNDMPL